MHAPSAWVRLVSALVPGDVRDEWVEDGRESSPRAAGP